MNIERYDKTFFYEKFVHLGISFYIHTTYHMNPGK